MARRSDLDAYTAFLARDRLSRAGRTGLPGRRPANVDPEIAAIAGPQLVVPVMNARYALNAANARWGSLYDALYGTDAIPEADGAEQGQGLQSEARRQGHRLGAGLPRRGRAARRRELERGRRLCGRRTERWPSSSAAARRLACSDPAQFAGYRGAAGVAGRSAAAATTACTSRSSSTAPTRSARPIRPASPTSCWNRRSPPSWTARIPIAAVDAADKVVAYRNWLGLMKGDLAEEIAKGGKTFTRRLNPDRVYTAPDGGDARRCPAAR